MAGMFLGSNRRNDPVILDDPHPAERYPQEPNNMARDGYKVLSAASPDYQGNRPPVSGSQGRTYRGPDNSFEQ